MAGTIYSSTTSHFNVLKPVPEPPSGTRTRPVEGLWNRKMDAVLIGGPGHVDAQHRPRQEAGVQGGGTAPLVGSPQKLATKCNYKHQFHIANGYFSTESEHHTLC